MDSALHGRTRGTRTQARPRRAQGIIYWQTQLGDTAGIINVVVDSVGGGHSVGDGDGNCGGDGKHVTAFCGA